MFPLRNKTIMSESKILLIPYAYAQSGTTSVGKKICRAADCRF